MCNSKRFRRISLLLIFSFLLTSCSPAPNLTEVTYISDMKESDKPFHIVETQRFSLSESQFPQDFTLSHNRLLVCDRSVHNVLIYTRDGAYLGKLAENDELSFPVAVNIDEKGHIFVLDEGENAILEFNKEDKFLKAYPLLFNKGDISGLSSFVIEDDDFYIATKSYKRNGLYKMGRDGAYSLFFEGYIGFTSIIKNQIFMTNSFYLENDDSITSGHSKLGLLNDNQCTEYQLLDRLVPVDFVPFHDKILVSCYGNGAINLFDRNKLTVAKIYPISSKTKEATFIWHMDIDEEKGDLFYIDTGSNEMVKAHINE